MDNMKKNIWMLDLIAVVLLLLGCLPLNNYGYYRFLRISVCAISAMSIMANNSDGFGWKNITWGIIAILFNPFVPVWLNKSTWIVIDIFCSMWCGYWAWDCKRKGCN